MSLSHHSVKREHILEQVKEIVLSIVKEWPVKVYLFGSWARGEERRTSDIDIGMWSESPLPAKLLTDIRSSLEESTIPYRVDVVDLTKSEQSFVKRVKEEGILWKD